MAPLHPHDLERPDATIRCWSGGVTGAPTVVMLHGATLDHRAWDPQVDALADRFHLVVPDLRAHGESTRCWHGSWSGSCRRGSSSRREVGSRHGRHSFTGRPLTPVWGVQAGWC